MFTGIVEEMGQVSRIGAEGKGFRLDIRASTVLEGTRLGDSIAVNGVCLTVTELNDNRFSTGLAPETLHRTNLGALKAGDAVNLERALTPSTRMGGHFVQGHVDACAHIIERRADHDALWLTLRCPRELMKYIVPKGFVTLDGTSLTVVDTGPDWFNVTLIAFTQAHVGLPGKHRGDTVNLEVDVLGKYVERQLAGFVHGPTVDEHFLQSHGYATSEDVST